MKDSSIRNITLIGLLVFVWIKFDFNNIIQSLGYKLLQEYFFTLNYAIIGTSIGILSGILIGYIVYRFRFLNGIVEALNIIIQNIPSIVLFPILIIAIGTGSISKLVAIGLSAMYPIYIAITNNQYYSQNGDINYFLKSLTNSSIKQYFRFYLRYILPELFASIKLALTYSFYTAITAEYIASTNGIGIQLRKYYDQYAYNEVYFITTFVIITSIIFVYMINKAEKKVLGSRNEK
jgi:NitT/TauT family transport system permease protein